MLSMVAEGGYTSKGSVVSVCFHKLLRLVSVGDSRLPPRCLSKERRVRKVELRLSVQELRAALDA